MRYQKIMETARLTLRPFIAGDAPRVAELAGDRRIYATTISIPHPYPRDAAVTWIATHTARFEAERAAVFALALQDGTVIGAVGVEPSTEGNSAELGYWIGPSYWGRGYCTEGARAVLCYAFNDLGYDNVCARHFDNNPASGRVMEKIGLRWSGVTPGGVIKDGVSHDLIGYALMVDELYGGRRHGEFAAAMNVLVEAV